MGEPLSVTAYGYYLAAVCTGTDLVYLPILEIENNVTVTRITFQNHIPSMYYSNFLDFISSAQWYLLHGQSL